ncbi:MAG: hypothetical protein ABIQ59_15325 [Nocardioidaceae bacterium]
MSHHQGAIDWRRVAAVRGALDRSRRPALAGQLPGPTGPGWTVWPVSWRSRVDGIEGGVDVARLGPLRG